MIFNSFCIDFYIFLSLCKFKTLQSIQNLHIKKDKTLQSIQNLHIKKDFGESIQVNLF